MANVTLVLTALKELGADLFEEVDPQEAEDAVGPDSTGDGTYVLLGQTDDSSNVWGIESTPERAEVVVLGDQVGHTPLKKLLRGLGWREVPDSYVGHAAFFVWEPS